MNRQIDSSIDSVWKILSDYPNICQWNSGVKVSYSTNELTAGVGAMRHCGLKPFGALEETVQVWEPPTKLIISIDSVTKMPMRNGRVEFNLNANELGCKVDVEYTYWTEWGPIGWLSIPFLTMMLKSGFKQFLRDLEIAAKSSNEN